MSAHTSKTVKVATRNKRSIAPSMMRLPKCAMAAVASVATSRYNGQMTKGSKHTEETKEKNRIAHLGKRTGPKNNKWKGKYVGYHGLHDWVRDNYGTPIKCDSKDCERRSTNYQWSNVSGKYKRTRDDWQQLCIPCHKKYDYRPSPFCRRGHELAVVGFLIDNRGSRICKECKKKIARRHYETHRQEIINRVDRWRKKQRSTIKRYEN